jgi:hypothetical protein
MKKFKEILDIINDNFEDMIAEPIAIMCYYKSII